MDTYIDRQINKDTNRGIYTVAIAYIIPYL